MNLSINFLVFKDSWKTFDDFFKLIAVFPSDAATFKERYGVFTNENAVDDFIDACASIQSLFEKLGGPKWLPQQVIKNPGYLSASTSNQKDIYSKLIWFSNQISNTVDTFENTFEELKPITKEASDGEAMADILIGTDGLSTKADNQIENASAISKDIDLVYKEFKAAFLTISKSEDLLNEANETIGKLSAANKRYNAKLEESKQEHGLFGKVKRKDETEELEKSIELNETEISKKEQFTTDLNTQVFLTGNKVIQDLTAVKNNLDSIKKYFSDIAIKLNSIAKSASDEQLSNYDWVVKAFDLPTATTIWKDIRVSNDNFSQSAFVSE